MKFDDIDNVVFLKNILTRLDKALQQTYEFTSHQEEHDSGGIPGFEDGYRCNVSVHSDGSGSSIKLDGCYLGVKLAYAIEAEINEQKERVLERLRELGVEV